jgi:HlyD family secretion protein
MSRLFKSIVQIAIPLGLAATSLGACSQRHAASLQGYVEGEFVYVASSQAGRLQRLAVTRGQTVAADAPLFSLEAVDEAAAQLQAQRQLDSLRAQLADLGKGKRLPEIEVIRAQLAQALAAARSSAAAGARDEAQYRAGGLSQAERDTSRAVTDANAARVQELRHQIEVAELPGRSEQIRSQSALVDAASAALTQEQWKLDQKSVSASHAGLVFDTLYREGEWVAAGNPVVRMLPPENIKLRFFSPESSLGNFAVGQRVLVHCDGCRADIAATVDYVAAEAEYTPPLIFSEESRSKLVYLVEARPDRSDARALHPGQPVRVSLP